LAGGYEPQPPVHRAGPAGRVSGRAVGGPSADADAAPGGGSRPGDRTLRVRAILDCRCPAVPRRPVLHRELDTARGHHG
jgi:hypothetical protein